MPNINRIFMEKQLLPPMSVTVGWFSIQILVNFEFSLSYKIFPSCIRDLKFSVRNKTKFEACNAYGKDNELFENFKIYKDLYGTPLNHD